MMQIVDLYELKRLVNDYFIDHDLYRVVKALVDTNKPITHKENYVLLTQFIHVKENKNQQLQLFVAAFFRLQTEENINLLVLLKDHLSFERYLKICEKRFNVVEYLVLILKIISYKQLLDVVNLDALLELNGEKLNVLFDNLARLDRHGHVNKVNVTLVIAHSHPDIAEVLIELDRSGLKCHEAAAAHQSPVKYMRAIGVLKAAGLLRYSKLLNDRPWPETMATAIVTLAAAKIDVEEYTTLLNAAKDPGEPAKTLVDLKRIDMLNQTSVEALIGTVKQLNGYYNYAYSVTHHLINCQHFNRDFYLLAMRHKDSISFAEGIEILYRLGLDEKYLNDLFNSKQPGTLAAVIKYLHTNKLLNESTLSAALPNECQIILAVYYLEREKIQITKSDFLIIAAAEKPAQVAQNINRLHDPQHKELLRYSDDPTKLTDVIINLKELQCLDSAFPQIQSDLIKQSKTRAEAKKEIKIKNNTLLLFGIKKEEVKPATPSTQLTRTYSTPSLVG